MCSNLITFFQIIIQACYLKLASVQFGQQDINIQFLYSVQHIKLHYMLVILRVCPKIHKIFYNFETHRHKIKINK